MKIKTKLLFIIGIIPIFLFFYWLKCQERIDLIKSIHLTSYLPVQALQNHSSVVYAQTLSQGKELITKEQSDWQQLWVREKDKASCQFKGERIVVMSESVQDWSLSHTELIEVHLGDVFSYSAKVLVEGKDAQASMSVVLYDKNKKVIRWHYGRQVVKLLGSREEIKGKFIVPRGVSFIRLRLTGAGIGKVSFEDVRFTREAPITFVENILSLENENIKFNFKAGEGLIEVLDKKINKQWKAAFNYATKDVLDGNPNELLFTLLDIETLQEFRVKVSLAKNAPEIIWEIMQEPKVPVTQIEFPPVFEASDKAEYIIPRGEGLIVDHVRLSNDFGKALRYGGGWPIPFLGVLDGVSGWMEVMETPDDFELAISKEGIPMLSNRWIGQKGEFGYIRKIRYIFFDRPNYVEMAKYYRQYAKAKGLVFPLKEKNVARKNNISKLIGAVNIWYWGADKAGFANDLAKSGIKKCLFSNVRERSDIEKVNKLGYLSSRYDIYQDVWPPIYDEVTKTHDGWPEDLVLDKQGNRIKGWVIKKGLKEYPGGVICSVPGLERAKRQIPKELQEKPYTSRFIDTTTASAWRECYNLKHPTNRTEDIKNKMELLELCSRELGLVTGSEDGAECAVQYVDYFEGMMSPGIGRLPGSGWGVSSVIYMTPTENFLLYDVGEKYRVPLWQLVYGDCSVATWYWDDSSNRIPEVWWRKDLLNILYGNMPLWAIRDYDHWKQYKQRFIESYNNVCPVFEKVGFLEMLSHRFVTEDRAVQETQFEGDIRIFVNFNEAAPFELKELNYSLPAKGFVVFEKGKVWKEGKCS